MTSKRMHSRASEKLCSTFDMRAEGSKKQSKKGQLFPGRPVVRSNIDFGRNPFRESITSCTKNYASAKSYAPGIITVKCVNRHLKLLGVSVMTKNEGVSTEQSVLPCRFEPLPKVSAWQYR